MRAGLGLSSFPGMQQLELGSGFKLSKGQDRLGPALLGAIVQSGHGQLPGLSGWDPQVRWAP